MQTISKSLINEMLVDCSTLESISFDLASKTALLSFRLDWDEKKASRWVKIQCHGLFQIVLVAHYSNSFSPLGIYGIPTLAKIDEIARAFSDQYIYEWDLNCDDVIEPKGGALQVFLANDPAPESNRRGITVFKDSDRAHFQLCIVGTDLWVLD